MKLTLSSLVFVTSTIFVIVKEVLGERIKVMIEDELSAPLALIKNIKDGNGALVPAIPQEYERVKDKDKDKLIFSYYYDDSNEKFLTACPANKTSMKELAVQRKWRNNDFIVNKASVLFAKLNERTDCKNIATPTIKKTEDTCSHSNGGVFYEVGFSVTTDGKEAKIQFIPVYKICYSTAEGTIYSLHHITSPNLLLLKVPAYYVMTDGLPTKLDKDLKQKLEEFKPEKDYTFYNLVELYNMPTAFYQHSIFFLFNYIRISYDDVMLRSIVKFEHFVRLFGKRTGKQLTLYSGSYITHYRTMEETTIKYCFMMNTCDIRVPVRSLWRIIKDSEDNAVLVVTQYTQTKCYKSQLICNGNIEMLKEYPKGGCTYLCPNLNENMIKKLGLPDTVKVSGHLELQLLTTSQQDQEVSSEDGYGPSDAGKSSSARKYIKMRNFIGDESFMTDLQTVDPQLERILKKDMPSDPPKIKASHHTGYTGGFSGLFTTTMSDTGGAFSGGPD